MTARLPRAAAALIVLVSAGAAAERLPATFEHPEASLVSRIEYPEIKGDANARLLCASQVQRSGKMEQTGCYVGTPGDEVYIRAVVKAADKARMRPATVDGKPLAVYVQFLVEFSKKGDEHTVAIHNHPGVLENVEAYGVNHVAAQRGLTGENWQKVCPRRTRFAVWVRAHVAWNGEQGSISVDPGEGPPITERCEQAIVATMQESVFIPARADGEAVPSTFIEPFGN